MRLLLKICGLTTPHNVRSVAELAPDFMGFIFYQKSSRYVPPKLVRSWSELIPEPVKATGVFVNNSAEEILQISRKAQINTIQLHGKEEPALCAQLKDKQKVIIKAFSISNRMDFLQTYPYEGCCDYFLFDARGQNPGGNGYSFNWDLLNYYQLKTPFLLAGGIQPDDWQKILSINHPRFVGVDLNSGFEDSPGIKNIEKLKRFKKKLEEGCT